jgi:hypothetical protein
MKVKRLNLIYDNENLTEFEKRIDLARLRREHMLYFINMKSKFIEKSFFFFTLIYNLLELIGSHPEKSSIFISRDMIKNIQEK